MGYKYEIYDWPMQWLNISPPATWNPSQLQWCLVWTPPVQGYLRGANLLTCSRQSPSPSQSLLCRLTKRWAILCILNNCGTQVYFYLKVLQGWSLNDTKYENVTTLLKGNCKRPVALEPSTPLGSTHHSDGYDHYQCGYLFANWGVEDVWIGLILLVVSLAALLLCLYGLMRVLNSLMEDQGNQYYCHYLCYDWAKYWLITHLT